MFFGVILTAAGQDSEPEPIEAELAPFEFLTRTGIPIFFQPRIEISAINPLRTDTALEFFGEYNTAKIDARITLVFSTDLNTLDLFSDKQSLANFAQRQRAFIRGEDRGVALPDSGRSIIIELGIIPLLVYDEYGVRDVVDLVGQISADQAERVGAEVVGNLFEPYISEERTNKTADRVYDFAEPVIDFIKDGIAGIAREIFDGVVSRHYGDTFVRTTAKKAFVGAFRVFDAHDEEAFVVYIKAGLDEQLIRSPLAEQMAVQSVHYLAGSATAPVAAAGMTATIGEGRSIDAEVSAYLFDQAFYQPISEIGNQLVTFSNTEYGDLSGHLRLTYIDEPREFEITFRGAALEGKPAGELRIRKGLGDRNTLYLDAAVNERNRTRDLPTVLDNSPLRIFEAVHRPPQLVRPVLSLLIGIPDRGLQDPGSSTYEAVLAALGRTLYETLQAKLELTVFGTVERGAIDSLRYGLRGYMKQRDTIGVSISWVRETFIQRFEVFGTLQYVDIDFRNAIELNHPFIRQLGPIPDDETAFELVAGGRVDFRHGVISRPRTKRRAQIENAARVEARYAEIVGSMAEALEDHLFDKGYLIGRHTRAAIGTLALDIYRNREAHPIPSLGRPFHSPFEAQARPDWMAEILKQELPSLYDAMTAAP